jgi:phytol kinase
MLPEVQNVLCSIWLIVYVKSVVGLLGILTAKGFVNIKIGRKIIHVFAGSFIAFWPWFRPEHWTWKLNISVYVLYAVSLFLKGAIIKDPKDPDVIAMCRRGDPTELLYGPFHFALSACYFGIRGFNKEEGVLIFSCLGFGDGLAPIVGMTFPFGAYPTFPFNTPDRKTLSGSLGFFFGSILGYCILRTIVLGGVEDLSKIIPVAAAAAIAEGASGDYDNLVVCITSYIASQYV